MGWIEKNARDCKKATFLIEKGMHTPLQLGDRMMLKLHLYGCSWCKTYQLQTQNIEMMIGKIFNQPLKEKLNDEFKNDLQILITKTLKNNK